MNWKQFLKPDIRKLIVTVILVLARKPLAERYTITMSAYNPIVVILMYILSCLVISVTNNLRRIGMLLLIISFMSVYYFTKDNMFGIWGVFLFSIPLFGISLLIFLLSFISKKASVSKETSLEEKRAKYSYPVLTKFAAWWLILVSIYTLKPFWNDFRKCIIAHESSSCYILTLLAFSGLFIFYFINFSLGVFLLKRRKRAWWMSVIILTFPLILALFNRISFLENFLFSKESFFIFIIPIILLLIDRKNFFKIAG